VQTATRKNESAGSESAAPKAPAPAAKKAKVSVLLITRDEMLWPQIGAHLSKEMILKQVDTVDELLTAVPSGQAAIVLWDARNNAAAAAAVLSRMQLHSPRFAVIALDDADSAHTWADPIALRQVVAHLPVPVPPAHLKIALESANEEVNARVALLGEAGVATSGTETPGAVASGAASPGGAAPSARKTLWVAAAIVAVLGAGAGAYIVLRHGEPTVAPAQPVPASPAHAAQQPAVPVAGTDEKVDVLIEKAQQAMLERHFIDPAEGSALALYKNALLLDPGSGEARQGLQRLAEILFARVQSALDERKFDVALQSLETARSISPGDSRLSALDQRIASLRAELGPAQILAAIAAQNFDRAEQLIDEAARSKSLNPAKLTQLRDELRRRHEEAGIENLVKLIDARLQQDKLIEPHNDSAAYYLGQARAAGATTAALQPQTQELDKRLAQTVRADIDQRRFEDADRFLADLHGYGVPAATVAALQHDLDAARGAQAAAAAPPPPPSYLDLAQSRLSQGKVTEPDNDSALFYVNQLRGADPKNSALPRLSGAVQAQIFDQARAALDAAQPAKAEALLQMAAGLGASAELTTLNQRLAQTKLAGAGPPEVTEGDLTKVKALELEYPDRALAKGVEGWVSISYMVTTEGKVTGMKVLDSSPAGVFEAAATQALSRVRYKPMLQGGKPIVVATKLRIAFRVAKK
jgi:TonB family protein